MARKNKQPGFENGPVKFDSPAPQGPGKTSNPVGRQAALPGDVQTLHGNTPGGFLNQLLSGRPGMEAERARPGDRPANVAQGFPAAGQGDGSGLVKGKGSF